jgi:hypothetical protein
VNPSAGRHSSDSFLSSYAGQFEHLGLIHGGCLTNIQYTKTPKRGINCGREATEAEARLS